MILFDCVAAFTSLLTLAASAPTRVSVSPPSTGLATVDLRIIGPQSNHYSTANQSPTSDQSQHLTVIVGQTLSLDHDALQLQGFQIIAIKAGESLSLLPEQVVEDDWRVECSALFDGRTELLVFDMKDNGVLLNEGRLAKVTRLNCAIAE